MYRDPYSPADKALMKYWLSGSPADWTRYLELAANELDDPTHARAVKENNQ